MGQVISHLVAADPNATLVAGIDRFTNRDNPYPVFTDLAQCDVDADVLIDFSTATAVSPLLDVAIAKKMPVVICTTGLNEEQIQSVHDAAKVIPVLFSANMSLGVNLLISLAKKATAILTQANFDIEIIESHHNQKIDAPSGTALAIADGINEVLNKEYAYTYDRSQERVKREKKEIGIHAIRGGTIVGEHTILYAGQDEIIELTHRAMSKDIFAVGAVNAAKFLATQEAGLYNMGHLMEL